MSDFVFQFNAHNVAPATGTVVMPKGDYDLIFDNAEIKPTKAGNGAFLEIRMKVINGEFKDNFVFERLNLWNSSQQSVDIAQRQLSALCHVTGFFVINSIQEMNNGMRNKPFKAHLDISLNDKKEPIGNEVKRLMNADGSLPGKAPASNSGPAPVNQAAFQPQPPAPSAAPQPSGGWSAPSAPPQPPAPQQWAPPSPQPQPPGPTQSFGQPQFGTPMQAPPNAPWLNK